MQTHMQVLTMTGHATSAESFHHVFPLPALTAFTRYSPCGEQHLRLVATKACGLTHLDLTLEDAFPIASFRCVAALTQLQHVTLGRAAVRDEMLAVLGRHCTQITSLCLRFCSEVTDLGLVALCRGLHRLVSVELSHCKKVSISGVACLAALDTVCSVTLKACEGVDVASCANLAVLLDKPNMTITCC